MLMRLTRALAVLALVCLSLVSVPPAFAQTASPAPAAASDSTVTLDQLVEAARASGATILIDGKGQASSTVTGTTPHPADALESAVAIRLAISRVLTHVPHIPGAIADGIASIGETHSPDWIWKALALTAVALAFGLFVAWLVWRWASRVLADLEAKGDAVPAPKTSYVLLRALLSLLTDLALLLSGIGLVIIAVPTAGPVRATAIVTILAVTAYRITIDILATLFLPDRPHERLLRIHDSTARRMLRQLKIIGVIGFAFLGLALWSNVIDVAPQTVSALRMLGSILPLLLITAFLIVHRKPITVMVRGVSQRPNTFRKFLGSIWLIVVVGYFTIAGAIHLAHLATAKSPQAGPLLAPILAAGVGLALYGICVIILARRFAALEHTLRAAMTPSETAPAPLAAEPPAPTVATEAPELEESTAMVPLGDGGGDDEDDDEAERPVPQTTIQPELDPEPLLIWQARWHRLFRRLAGLAATVVSFAIIVVALGILQVDENLTKPIGLIVVLFALWGFYDAMRTWIDGKMVDEMPSHDGHGHSEDGMGPGASRLATLLPLMRNVLVITMFTLMAAVGLSALGVNVAPLFAGAGVLGLAIGFGAQTLIRDVFSGAFFLVDDAFRKGEFIDVGGTMGAVEKISVRSFQLRHQNGPLHTIPFGAIKQLTNFSRDWVVMKLPLRVPYGTDVEKLRKLIKKLGQQLLEDPEIGHLFLQPLKSQGVIEMEDSAMILRVKFMTKPGDQFVVRREVYAAIGDLFDREGIEFAHRYVTVRIDPPDTPPEQQRQAAAAAAEQIIREEQAAKQPKSGGDDR